MKIDNELIDCTSCAYGRYNDHWNTLFCYCDEECIDWNKYKRKDKLNETLAQRFNSSSSA